MEIRGALEIIEALADGLDPETGEPAAQESALQQPDTVRALHLALTALGRGMSKQPHGTSNSYNAWSAEEDAQLCKEFLAHVQFAEIANIHGRSRGAIVSRLEKLGKINPAGKDREVA
jgi:hypothetical protein